MKAYKHKGMKSPEQGDKRPVDKKSASKAPKHQPKMMEKVAPGHYKSPKSGEQSMAPKHKDQKMTKEGAAKGVSGVNEGVKVEMPKSGAPGQSKV